VRPLAGALTDQFQELNEIIDIIVEVEAAVRQRNHLRVAPVGNVNVVARQQALDRAAQQGRIVARHWRDDQQAGAGLDALADKMLELSERLPQQNLLTDRHALAADANALDAEFGLAVRSGRVGEYFEARGDQRPHRAVTPGIGGIAEPPGSEPG